MNKEHKLRPVATAPIRPLAWELPYATGAAQGLAKKDKKKKTKKRTQTYMSFRSWLQTF